MTAHPLHFTHPANDTTALAAAQNPLLIASLQLAVPLQIERLRQQPEWVLDDLQATLANQLQQGSDAMQFGGTGAGAAHAAHARSLAYLALRAEGGVDFAGLHWCAIRYCRASSRYDHANDTPEAPPAEPPRPRTVVNLQLPDYPAPP